MVRAPEDLRVNDRARPLEVATPRFGWRCPAGLATQAAYRIGVERVHGDEPIWDSGRVPGSAQSYRPYDGPPLPPGTTYRWRVQVWDAGGTVSPWSEPGEFGTGLGDTDWEASWIRRAPAPVDRDEHTLARLEFTPGPSTIVAARLYLSAYHQYEAWIDGTVVDRGPAYSYPGEGYYQATDVTGQLDAGRRSVLAQHLLQR